MFSTKKELNIFIRSEIGTDKSNFNNMIKNNRITENIKNNPWGSMRFFHVSELKRFNSSILLITNSTLNTTQSKPRIRGNNKPLPEIKTRIENNMASIFLFFMIAETK